MNRKKKVTFGNSLVYLEGKEHLLMQMLLTKLKVWFFHWSLNANDFLKIYSLDWEEDGRWPLKVTYYIT